MYMVCVYVCVWSVGVYTYVRVWGGTCMCVGCLYVCGVGVCM